jgi:hypothetical protein
MREANRIEYLKNLLELERLTLESVSKQRDEVQSDLEFRRELFKVQEHQHNTVRASRDGLQRELTEMTAYADKLAAGFPEGMLPKDVEVLREANAKLAEEVGDYRGLLIELYNDINVIHSGNAVRKLNKMFREENYN